MIIIWSAIKPVPYNAFLFFCWRPFSSAAHKLLLFSPAPTIWCNRIRTIPCFLEIKQTKTFRWTSVGGHQLLIVAQVDSFQDVPGWKPTFPSSHRQDGSRWKFELFSRLHVLVKQHAEHSSVLVNLCFVLAWLGCWMFQAFEEHKIFF